MGCVPHLVLSISLFGLVACEADQPAPAAPPPPSTTRETAEEIARDAGDAAREAIERASEALRKLGAVAISARDAGSPEPASKPTPPLPVEEAPIVDLEAEQAAKRDASSAAAEAKDKLVEVTKRAVESVRAVGQGVVDAISDKSKAPATE